MLDLDALNFAKGGGLVAVVAQGPEGEAAHGALEHDPAGHPDDVVRLLAGLQLVVPDPADLLEGVGAPEADRVGLDPGRPQPGQLDPARLLDR